MTCFSTATHTWCTLPCHQSQPALTAPPPPSPGSNNTPLDIFGLYRGVIKAGGLQVNERYDERGRWAGGVNFAGDVFPRMSNWTANNKATSVGNQLLSNYKKFLLAYERAYLGRDLPHLVGRVDVAGARLAGEYSRAGGQVGWRGCCVCEVTVAGAVQVEVEVCYLVAETGAFGGVLVWNWLMHACIESWWVLLAACCMLCCAAAVAHTSAHSLRANQRLAMPASLQAGTSASAGAHAAAPAGSQGGGGDPLALLAEVAGTHSGQQGQQEGPERKRRRTSGPPALCQVEGAAQEVARMQAAAVGGGQFLPGQVLLAQDPQHPDRWGCWAGTARFMQVPAVWSSLCAGYLQCHVRWLPAVPCEVATCSAM